MSAPEEIKKLVTAFDNDIKYFKSKAYDEENNKVNFINPFFEALGWDVTNKAQKPPKAKDVKFEAKVDIEGRKKAPDYEFRYKGVTKFFVEAKKPSISIETDNNPAFQLRRYMWSADLGISILTDFEELAIYENFHTPTINQDASIDRLKIYKYTDYCEKWDEIYDLLSKKSVEEGKFDDFIENHPRIQKGNNTVDDKFLTEMNDWRNLLAVNIATNNTDITLEELNYAVQLTIDRIIFFRMAEDRDIEKYGRLKKLLDSSDIYKQFGNICKSADLNYNSGLFHFREEKLNPDDIDTFTLNLKIDNWVLKHIFENLYYPNSPYEFSVISPEILGNVYEQFLGKVISLDSNHKAIIENKPEVVKAGGIVYTPQYVVKYIIDNTLGKLLNKSDMTPNKVKNIKIVDPSCGSGSFLLKAYQYLLDWHLDYYSNYNKPPKDIIEIGASGENRLTIKAKKDILLNNIFGVDIDTNAVEVTKLSLLLKVLENENKEEIQIQTSFERALPNLSNNIKAGNSLIGTDIYKNKALSQEELISIKPFDWEKEFPQVFNNGGFDIVIGNPPYLGESGYKEQFRQIKLSKVNKDYLMGKTNLFCIFSCFGIDLLKDKGHMGYITPNNWVTSAGAKNMREKIRTDTQLSLLTDFGDYKVFKKSGNVPVGQQTMIFCLRKNNSNKQYTVNYSLLEGTKKTSTDLSNFLNPNIKEGEFKKFKATFNRNELKDKYFKLVNETNSKIINKIQKLKNVFYLDKKEVIQGIAPNPDRVTKRGLNKIDDNIIKKYHIKIGDFVFMVPKGTFKNLNNVEKSFFKPVYEPNELGRYYFPNTNKYNLMYLTKDNTKNINEKDIPHFIKHITPYKQIMESRRENIKGSRSYYNLHWPRDESFFKEGAKILSVRKATTPTFTYTEEEAYVMLSFNIIKTGKINLKVLSCILNSKLITYWLKYTGKLQGSNYQVDATELFNLPLIKPLELENEFLNKFDEIRLFNKRLNEAKDPTTRRLLNRQIKQVDKDIDCLVYQLYNLDKEDINIIENEISNVE